MKSDDKVLSARLNDESLLRLHQLHTGVYARIANKLNVDPSYVSRVASGERQSDKVKKALVAELDRIERVSRRPARLEN